MASESSKFIISANFIDFKKENSWNFRVICVVCPTSIACPPWRYFVNQAENGTIKYLSQIEDQEFPHILAYLIVPFFGWFTKCLYGRHATQVGQTTQTTLRRLSCKIFQNCSIVDCDWQRCVLNINLISSTWRPSCKQNCFNLKNFYFTHIL